MARGAAIGLSLGLFGGALFLLFQAARALFHPLPCEALGTQDCSLIQQSARELARMQALVGAALLLLAAALAFPLLRRRPPKGA